MTELTRKIVEKFLKQTEKGEFNVGEGEEAIKYRLSFLRAQSGSEKGDQIVLDIPDMDLFVKKVEKYFLIVQGLYRNEMGRYDLTYEAYLERLFVSLMSNMTYSDAHNVYNYIDQRTELYVNCYDRDEKLGKFSYTKGAQVKECEVNVIIDRLSSIMEAPYSFTPEFTDGINVFFLPSITFGLSVNKKTAYVYAVQNRKKDQSNSLQKDLDRYFRKIGKGVEGEEELMQVSPNALVSLTMFCSYLKEQGVQQIISKDFQPSRYKARESRILSKYAEGELEALDNAQFNITNKFMYLFLRYSYHFPDCECDFDIDQGQMIMKLKEGVSVDNNIIYDIDRLNQSKINENDQWRITGCL